MQVFKEEEEAIKVDLHEGCGRTKLFWLMALADSKTMKAMVEFREHTGCLYVFLLPLRRFIHLPKIIDFDGCGLVKTLG